MRKKRIFGPRRDGRRLKLILTLLVLSLLSFFSFSAGLYVGATESQDRSLHLAATDQVAPQLARHRVD